MSGVIDQGEVESSGKIALLILPSAARDLLRVIKV